MLKHTNSKLQGQSEYIDASDANDKDFTGGLQGTFYFKDVDSSKGPLAEAAFLNQASNVSLAYNYAELGSADDSDFISHNHGAKAEAYIPTKLFLYMQRVLQPHYFRWYSKQRYT